MIKLLKRRKRAVTAYATSFLSLVSFQAGFLLLKEIELVLQGNTGAKEKNSSVTVSLQKDPNTDTRY